jgi:hypothetical protein
MNREGCGRNWTRHIINRLTILAFAWKSCNNLRIVDAPTEIRTCYHPNRNQMCYSSSQLHGERYAACCCYGNRKTNVASGARTHCAELNLMLQHVIVLSRIQLQGMCFQDAALQLHTFGSPSWIS